MGGDNEPDESHKTFWIQMRKSKPLDKSHKTGRTSGTKMAFYSLYKLKIIKRVKFENHINSKESKI
ncbi:hypothetical protein Hanom_Chr08g00741251 [Helianthus anomalus]